MNVSFITQNAYQKYPQLQRDVDDVKGKVEKVESMDSKIEKSVFGSIPPVRRVMSLSDKFENGETTTALGLASLAVINLPEDFKDIKSAYEQVNAKIKGQHYAPKYDTSKYQHNFSFFKGTLLQRWFDNIKTESGKEKVYKWYEKDKSLYSSKFGDKVKNFLGITDGEVVNTNIKNVFGDNMEISEIKANSKFAELTGRSMKRVTVLGVAALVILELPKIFKSMSKGDNISEQAGNTAKQATKSVINVTSLLAGIGYGGALGVKKFGAVGSIVGMGVGAVIGATASSKIQNIIA